jgi:hypothetical protein
VLSLSESCRLVVGHVLHVLVWNMTLVAASANPDVCRILSPLRSNTEEYVPSFKFLLPLGTGLREPDFNFLQ